MINITFLFGNQIIEVKIIGSEIYFAEVRGAKAIFVPIEKLKLSVAGILKEFPDLAELSEGDIKIEGIKRFKEKMRKMDSEENIAGYIIKDLTQYGYVPKLYQKNGFRPQIL